MQLFNAVLAIGFSVLGAQNPVLDGAEPFEIRGRVVEFGISQGIGDAEVTLERYKTAAVSSFVDRDRIGTVKTDSSGSFAYRVASSGRYRLTVTKDGYVEPGGVLDRSSWISTEVSVDADKPRSEVRFALARPAQIAGRVIDGTTKRPVAGMPVRLLQYGYVRGRVWFMPGSDAVTDEDGRFVAPKLPPTDYVIALQPRIRAGYLLGREPTIPGEPRLLSGFSQDDLEKVDYDYDWTYWPGGANPTDALPIALGSGAQFDVGLLTIEKVPKYRARISVVGEECRAGERLRLHVAIPSNRWVDTSVGETACGQDALVRGFAPGSYQLEVMGQGGKRGWIPFSIVDKNITLAVPISRGVTIDGKVVTPEGTFRPDLQSMKVVLFPFGWTVQNEPGTPDVTGRFAIPGALAREFQLLISGVPRTHYLKEVHYNGRRLEDDILAVDARAYTHSLELLLGDGPATVSGTVTDDGKPVRRANVVLVRWPPHNRELFSSVSRRDTDESGRVTFDGVAPGEYRLLAVSADDKPKLERPNVLSRLLVSAERLALGERQYRQVSLKLTVP